MVHFCTFTYKYRFTNNPKFCIQAFTYKQSIALLNLRRLSPPTHEASAGPREDRMKNLKTILIVFAIIAMTVILVNCQGAVGVDITPHPKDVTIWYERVLPAPYPDATAKPIFVWSYYGDGQPHAGFTTLKPVGENTFSCEVRIMTEAKITVCVVDPKYGGEWVCKRLFVEAPDVDKQEVPAETLQGQVAFILGNDGKVRKYS
jgi:hypothetical protein